LTDAKRAVADIALLVGLSQPEEINCEPGYIIPDGRRHRRSRGI